MLLGSPLIVAILLDYNDILYYSQFYGTLSSHASLYIQGWLIFCVLLIIIIELVVSLRFVLDYLILVFLLSQSYATHKEAYVQIWVTGCSV